ncbi:MAG: PhzF family phenazine biosynthesis protein [Anaerovorax sp.]|nr:PhzF family phenazine biosynthesis protein [Anaerovorax sp.]
MNFYIVDAFTDQVFGGNPAGVVLLEAGMAFPSNELMRKTAAELRYSETAFVRPINEKEFNIRYFTPAAEVDLCGHATIASFCALQQDGIINSGESYINDTLAGRLNIEVNDSFVMMDMGQPQSLPKMERQEELQELYRVMGLSYENQGVIKNTEKILLPQLVSTGLFDIMMPVASVEELAAICPDFSALSALSERYNVTGVHAFTVNSDDGAVHCRNFAPLYNIDEEAATGTSNGALTYYLYVNGFIKADQENLFIQGEAMDRPSKIISHLKEADEKIKIQVGGRGIVLAKGEIFI